MILMLFLIAISTQNTFEGILVYETNLPNAKQISIYFLRSDKIKTTTHTYRSDSIETESLLFDFSKDCINCYYQKKNNDDPVFIENVGIDPIAGFLPIDTTYSTGDTILSVEMLVDQTSIGYGGNEMYVTRDELSSLRYKFPKHWTSWIYGLNAHRERIATKLTRTMVLNTPEEYQKTVIETKLISYEHMPLSDSYFEL